MDKEKRKVGWGRGRQTCREEKERGEGKKESGNLRRRDKKKIRICRTGE